MSANYHLATRAERVALTARLVANARAGNRSRDEREDHPAAIRAMWDEVIAKINAEFAADGERETDQDAADAGNLWDAITKKLNAEARRHKRQARAG